MIIKRLIKGFSESIRYMKLIPISIVSILLLLPLWGCSAEHNDSLPATVSKLDNLIRIPADIQPIYDITIQKDIDIGNINIEKELMGGINDIAVDDSGRVYLADTQQKTIHVFSSDGQFLQNLGRRGSGPGEFGHIFDMKIQGNRLFAFDPTLYRINYYSLETMSFDRVEGLFFQDWSDIQNIDQASPVKFYDWGGDNNMLIGFRQIMGPNIYYYIVKNSNHRTNIISNPIIIQKQDRESELIVKFGNVEIPVTPPFARKSLIAVSKDRHIFSAWTDLFLIKEYDPEGVYLRAWYYPYNNQPLTQADLDSFAASMGLKSNIQRALDGNKLPSSWPALYNMKIDDQGRFWISTVIKDHSKTEWWVLEKDGTLLARFTWLRGQSIEEIKNNYLYTIETDLENGLQKVGRYRIKMH